MNELPEGAVEIAGVLHVEIVAKYDYSADKSRCPACGGLGIPWGGWFHCDDCTCFAEIATGRCFVQTGRADS